MLPSPPNPPLPIPSSLAPVSQVAMLQSSPRFIGRTALPSLEPLQALRDLSIHSQFSVTVTDPLSLPIPPDSPADSGGVLE